MNDFEVYTVVRGDTLSGLAVRLLGSGYGWQDLWSYNRHIVDPNRIEVGDTIYYPRRVKAANTLVLDASGNIVSKSKSPSWLIPALLASGVLAGLGAYFYRKRSLNR